MASIAANSLAMIGTRLLTPAVSFAINIGIGRMYGATALGAYVQLISLLIIFQTAATAGLPLFLIREIAAQPAQTLRWLRRARTFAFLSGGLSTLILLAYSRWILSADQMGPALILATTVLPSAWISIQEAFFVAARSHHYLFLIAILENGLKLFLTVLAFVGDGGLLILCSSIAASRLLALASGHWLVSRAGFSKTWRPLATDILPFARTLAPFAALLTLSIVYFRVDVVIMGKILPPSETGLYGAALTLYSVFLLFPDSIMSAVYPRLAAVFQESVKGYAHTTLLSARLLLALALGASSGLICFAEILLTTCYGPQFRAAASTLRLLAASLPIHALNSALGQGLQAGHLQKPTLFIIVCGVALHILFNIILLPVLGANGAAITLLGSSSLVAIGLISCFHKNVMSFRFGAREMLSLASLGASLGLTLGLVFMYPLTSLMAGIAWLCNILLILRGVPRADLHLVLRALRMPRETATL